ncbi:MAG: ChaN family lipoprotein [Paracoccaceae bacterium]
MTFRAVALALVLAAPVGAEQIDEDGLDSLPSAQVVILGELHDNPFHHENQARAVAALEPAALVFEMLTEAQAERVTPELRGDEAALEEALGWADSGWPDFSMYYPIFAAAPDARVFGAAIPRDRLRQSIREGTTEALGRDAARFGLDMPLPEAQQATREAMQMEAHCNALPESLLPGMVLGQRMRDAALARAALDALEATGGPVALITGNGHARNDWGVPAKLALAQPLVTVLSLGQLEAPPGADGPPPYDLWLITDTPEREDPCAAFR